MNVEFQKELEAAVRSSIPLGEIVSLLRRYKSQGTSQREVYRFLESLHQKALDETTDDRILEVSDFVAGFCSSPMRIWEGTLSDGIADQDDPMTRSKAS